MTQVGSTLSYSAEQTVPYNNEANCSSSSNQAVIPIALAVIALVGAVMVAALVMRNYLLGAICASIGGGVGVYLSLYILLGSTSREIIASNEIDTAVLKTQEPEPIIKPSFPADVYLGDVPYQVKQAIPIKQQDLAQLICEIHDDQFTTRCRDQGIVYYDPTNELPIPFEQLYQNLIFISQSSNSIPEHKKNLIYALLAKELDLRWKHDENRETSIRKCVKYFPIYTIKAIGFLVSDLKLKSFLTGFDRDTRAVFRRAVLGRADLLRQIRKVCPIETVYFGATRDDGSCFFHAVAQTLSHALGTTITEKKLRSQCKAYITKLESSSRTIPSKIPSNAGKTTVWVEEAINAVTFSNAIDYETTKRELDVSSREICETKSQKLPLWGEWPTYGQIIAELYGIELTVFEAVLDDETGASYDADPKSIVPYRGNERITLREIGINGIPVDTNKVIRIAILDRHVFPIWIDENP